MTSAPRLPDDEAVIALGANLGDTARTLREAVRALDATPGLAVLAESRAYDTDPVGPAQPRYRNAALRLRSSLAPLALLDVLLAIERAHGRERSRETRWGPRTLDLDLLLVGDVRLESERLVLPHPRMMERAFVLAPLCDLFPGEPALRLRLDALGGSPPLADRS